MFSNELYKFLYYSLNLVGVAEVFERFIFLKCMQCNGHTVCSFDKMVNRLHVRLGPIRVKLSDQKVGQIWSVHSVVPLMCTKSQKNYSNLKT